ncbi:MAG: hypothetical protein WCS09_14355 [Pseudomonadota bacterium]
MSLDAMARLRGAASSLGPRIGWMLGGLVHSVGWAGLAGGLLLLAGVGGLGYSGFWLESALDLERAAVAEAARQVKARPPQAVEVRPPPAARLDEFYAGFPEAGEIPAVIRTLIEIAGKQSLALDQGQYRLVDEAGGTVMRYQMKLPVRGTYRQLRAFVEQALAQLPALALDGVEFRREAVGSTGLESVVEFSLYVRPR